MFRHELVLETGELGEMFGEFDAIADMAASDPNAKKFKSYGRTTEDDPNMESGERFVELICFDRPLKVYQDPLCGCGGNLWNSALFAVKYLENENVFPADFFKGKRVLELGAGTGYVGIALARKGAEVWLTDQVHVVPLLQKNADANLTEEELKRTHCIEYDWCKEPVNCDPPFDLIICADCVYNPTVFDPLIHTLERCMDNNTIVLISYQIRRKHDKQFFYHAAKTFNMVDVDKRNVPLKEDEVANFRRTRISVVTTKSSNVKVEGKASEWRGGL